MNEPLPPSSAEGARRFLEELEALFADMDAAYRAAAAHYGFHCAGCEDNCCRTRFHHHTCLEVLYLRRGLETLGSGERGAAVEAAQAYAAPQDHPPGKAGGAMCPLNRGGSCILYAQRPMICRLHGIPHELRRPGGPPVRGPGCGAFHQNCGRAPYHPFDRSPYYARMAELERRLRQAIGFSHRVRLTVADILLLP